MNKYILTATVLISGCAPLQQAPLVYTSKQVLGIDISAPTTESAGISLNVGFKNIDAAYIPVAVSKKDGLGDSSKIMEIYATYGKGRKNDEAYKKLDEEQKTKIDQLGKTIKDKDEKITQLENSKNQLEQYNASVKRLNQEQSEQSEIKEKLLDENIKSLKDTLEIPSEVQEKINQKQILTEKDVAVTTQPLVAAVQDSKAKEKDARKELEQTFDESKRDAMSVFGSFDSAVDTGKATGPTHNLGKIFSTGVAAQNLTQGFQIQSILQQCTELLGSIKDEGQQKNLVNLCINSYATVNNQK